MAVIYGVLPPTGPDENDDLQDAYGDRIPGNTTIIPVDLTGWRIVDKNDLADTLNGVQLRLVRRR